MDYPMKSVESAGNDSSDAMLELDWQIDSNWVTVTPPSMPGLTGISKKKSKSASSSPAFHFIPTSKGERFLVVKNQTLRFSQKTATGLSFWVCSVPCCSARCILDAEEKRIARYVGDHNHGSDMSRMVYRNFIHALNVAVKENPHVKPKVLYDTEVERALNEAHKDGGFGSEVNDQTALPSFEAVRTAMYNTRNAVLSSFSLKAAEEAEDVEEAVKHMKRATRSKEGKTVGKRKLKLALGSADLDGLGEDWTDAPHKNADLSDFEDWLEEDANANISPVVGRKEFALQDSFDLTGGDYENDENDLWSSTSPLEKIPRRKYRKRPASMSIFTCPNCPYKSNRHFNVQRHERLAHSSKKPEYSCKECGTSYSLEYRLKLHIKAVHQGEGHHCHICSRTFETMTGLKSHIVTKHKNEDHKIQREPPPELTCNLCGRVFTSKAHLLKHTNTHIMVQPFRCYTCNQPFLDECTWLTHQNNCGDPFVIQCCLCSAVIATPKELKMHMDVFHGRAEYSCQCGKTFPWKKSLLTHQQKCSLCLAERTSTV